MATDTESRFVLAFDGKSGTINSVLQAVKSQVRAAVADIESTTAKIDAFKGLEASVQTLGKSFTAAQDRAAEFRRQIAQIQGSGGEVGKELIRSLKLVEAEITRTSKAYNRQSDQLAAMNASLAAAGVNVSKLAAEELRLAEALKTANAAAAQQSAKDLLGFKTLADVTPKIKELSAAFNTLRSSGKLTSTELAAAQQTLRERIAEVRAQVTGTAEAARAGAPTLASFFSGAVLPAIGLSVGIGSISAKLKEGVAAAIAFNNALARVGTATTLSNDELAAFGKRVEQLSVTLGINAVEALKTFRQILREGIDPDEAFALLEASAKAAIVAMEDINVVAKVGADLISAYGVSVGELPALFDKLIVAANSGGASFADLANDIGKTAIAARAAGVSAEQLIGLITQVADVSGDGAGAVAALQKILVQWNTEAVRERLRALNIEATGFVDVMRELARRGIPVTQLVDLGIAGTRTAVGINALTRSSQDLEAALSRAKEGVGETNKRLDDLAGTAERNQGRISAAFDQMLRNAGNSSLKLLGGLEGIADGIAVLNRMPIGASIAAFFGNSVLSAQLLREELDNVGNATRQATVNTQALSVAERVAAKATEEYNLKLREQLSALTGVADRAAASAQAVQSMTDKTLAGLQKAADEQVAGLDRSAAKAAETAAKTLEIQTKLGVDRLAAITAGEEQITALLNKTVAARELVMRAANKTEQQIAQETNRIRLAALEPVLAQYTDHYNKLVAQAQSYKQRVESIEQTRIAFNEGLEKTLFGIRVAGLSAFDQYVAKVQETEKLIAKAREEGAKGNIQAAEKYTQDAIALSGTIEKAVREDGTEIISQFQAQETKLGLMKKAGAELNTVYQQQGSAAKIGADATKEQIDAVLPKIAELRGAVEALNKKAAEGVKLKVDADQASFAKTEAQIAELTRERTVIIRVQEVREGEPAPSGFARGGTVGEMVRRFAGGGHVFRRPAWMKVPGSGDGDTVPAALNAGSFVVRKSASRYYGDSIMGRLAQGFATGGKVTRLLGSSPIAARILSRVGNEFVLGDGLGSNASAAEYADTLGKLRQLQEQAQGLPRPSNGMSMAEWAGWIVSYFNQLSERKQKQIKAVVEEGFEGWLVGIENARAIHVPIAMDFSLAALASLAYARGGAGPAGAPTDTVPAMLTPGEWVIKQPAVAKYGSGLLHAINSMQVPRAALQNMLAPPQVRRFAYGGQVGGPMGIPERGGGSASTTINYNVRVDGDSLLSEDVIRRKVLPVLNDIQKRSR